MSSFLLLILQLTLPDWFSSSQDSYPIPFASPVRTPYSQCGLITLSYLALLSLSLPHSPLSLLETKFYYHNLDCLVTNSKVQICLKQPLLLPGFSCDKVTNQFCHFSQLYFFLLTIIKSKMISGWFTSKLFVMLSC